MQLTVCFRLRLGLGQSHLTFGLRLRLRSWLRGWKLDEHWNCWEGTACRQELVLDGGAVVLAMLVAEEVLELA